MVEFGEIVVAVYLKQLYLWMLSGKISTTGDSPGERLRQRNYVINSAMND